MARIHVLDSETIDKIAAGEVVERPASVVKELVENAMDAGASAVTVEIKDGGISFIRVTDNGCGIEREQLRTAFLRHTTSKIQSAEDLAGIVSLGFRGEALSSISAVAKVEVITKTAESITGSRMILEGAREIAFEEIGAPEGTTFLVRNLFFNTPVRRKFLRQPATEGGYITDLMERLALSRPEISFKLVLGGQMRFHTSGNGDVREVIYRIYGRETADALVPIRHEENGVRIEGYLGAPALIRSSRNFEIYFINGRYIRSNVVSRAVEEGYKAYLMQHKFPFCVLYITLDAERVDVNVHPSKMDVRFTDVMAFGALLGGAVEHALKEREMIPKVRLSTERERRAAEKQEHALRESVPVPEPFETRRSSAAEPPKMQEFIQNVQIPVCAERENSENGAEMQENSANSIFFTEISKNMTRVSEKQLNLFEERILTEENRPRFRLIGQVFETYWLIEFEEKLLMIDQHAAHEKVHYERLIKQFRERNAATQALMPPIIVSLSGQEEAVLREHMDVFTGLGFEIEGFGGSEYVLRGVPTDLYGCGEREMFTEVLDQLAEGRGGAIRVAEEKIASMSCKAAVKGSRLLSTAEAERLIDELLTLENPYNCPHGRPTVIAMGRAELERKFKRIV